MLLMQKIAKKEKILTPLLVWLAIPIVLLIAFRHNILDQFFVSQIPLFILLTAIVIDSLWQRKQILGGIILTVIVLTNLFSWWKNIPTNREIFFQSTQPDLRYSDELATIDDIYKSTNKEQFSFQSYTIPYWTQQAWQYLFWFYGRQKYGFLPITENSKTLFVIIQEDPSNKPYQNDWLQNTVSKWGKPGNVFRHGVLTTIKLDTQQ
jgi:hypothetical protein